MQPVHGGQHWTEPAGSGAAGTAIRAVFQQTGSKYVATLNGVKAAWLLNMSGSKVTAESVYDGTKTETQLVQIGAKVHSY